MVEATNYRGLEACIDSIVESYQGDDPINNLESSSLPNKQKVITGLLELEPILYMGFFATRSLNHDNLRHALAEHMYRAHDILFSTKILKKTGLRFANRKTK